MIIHDITERVEVPHEPGEWFIFRKPNWVELKHSKQIEERENRQVAKEFGAAFIREMREGDENTARKAIKALQYAPSQYDTMSLLLGCVDDWSYLDPDTGDNLPVDEKWIGKLDDRTVDWAKEWILNSVRPLNEEEQDLSSSDSSPTSTEEDPVHVNGG